MNEWRERLGMYPSLLLGLALAAGGGFILIQLVNNVWPFDVEQRLDLARAVASARTDAAALWGASQSDVISLFLAAVFAIVTGLSLPIVHFLNGRFGPRHTPSFIVTLRQSLWIGLWAIACVLLQMNRALGPAVAALLAVVLLIFEFLLQARARARAA